MKTFNELLQEAHWQHTNRNFDHAAQIYRDLLRIKPDHPMLSDLLGRVRFQQGRYAEALQLFEKACRLNPAEVSHHYFRGRVLLQEKRTVEAAEAFARACGINPGYEYSFTQLARLKRLLCDWSSYAQEERQIDSFIADGKAPINPMVALHFSDDPAAIRQCAEQFSAQELRNAPSATKFAPAEIRERPPKIRVAYVSADFRDHAMTHLLSEMFELHDRSRFEVIGISIGDKDESPFRKRVERSFDRFFDALDWPMTGIPARLRELKPDILVDLHGHTNLNLLHIFAQRPAPIQVNYLGYPGTSGAGFFDYIIGDPVITPLDHAAFYSEKIVQLPDCYQPNDRRRAVAETTPTRGQCGLPEQGFIFASMNNSMKITPQVFAIWMRLLKSLAQSVLWIYVGNDPARENLRKEAAAAGIDPARIVFAPPAKHAEHLARQKLADLFLDTFPYTGHTTVSDALWIGLPVVTCLGNSFASRVSASLVTAAGLPELAATTFEEYEQIALSLAGDSVRLRAIRTRLQENRDSCALFDTPRYCRNLESAYETMLEIKLRGEEPHAFIAGAGVPIPDICAAE